MADQDQAPPPVTFRVSTYWKRKRGEPGLTRMDSQRLVASQVIDWVLAEFPDDAVTITSVEPDSTVITIDWTRVRDEIRYGRPG
jgi:hypothetical protein